MSLTIAVVGMGYVGLTLTAALGRAGHTVYGVDTNPDVLAALSAGRPHIREPGLDEVLIDLLGQTIHASSELPSVPLDAVMISVSTPVDEQHRPVLEHLASATRQVARVCGPETVVVVRSTVPVGTTRGVVLPILERAWGPPLLCMAPERTIQGQALRELVQLPQVVGGLDDASLAAGVALFEQLATSVVPVSSLETAELVKLSNNCHTDLIYGFGNEIALIAEGHGIDPLEVIRACNLDYPRPDLSRPGYVGGACLTKDPYIMLASGDTALTSFLVARARELNEYLPGHVARSVIELLRERSGEVQGRTVGVLGWACKGFPPTDDMRGSAVESLVPVLLDAGIKVLGHDPEVSSPTIARYGGVPCTLEELVAASDGILVVNDHPLYRSLDLPRMTEGQGPGFVFDSWRILDEEAITSAGMAYAGIGYRAAVAA